MSKCKFKVGDIVICKSDNYPMTRKGWVGKVTKVYSNGKFDARGNDGFLGISFNFVNLDPKDFDLYTKNQCDKIVITTDGKTTTAKMYRDKSVVKVETTNCHPEDRFDFMAGAKIAFDRLVGEKKEEPAKPKYKIGEKVVIDTTNVGDGYVGTIGEIVNIDLKYSFPYLVKFSRDNKTLRIWSKVSGYAPKYYNGKVVCVDKPNSCNCYTVGKIYQIVDGVMRDDYGIPKGNLVRSFDEWQSFSQSKWLEVVE